jgi:hypothetical protein
MHQLKLSLLHPPILPVNCKPLIFARIVPNSPTTSEHTIFAQHAKILYVPHNAPAAMRTAPRNERRIPIQSASCGHCICLKLSVLRRARARIWVKCAACRQPTACEARNPIVSRSISSFLEEDHTISVIPYLEADGVTPNDVLLSLKNRAISNPSA